MKSLLIFTLLALTYTINAQNFETEPLNIKTQNVLTCKLPENKLYQKEEFRIYRLIEGQVHFLRGLLRNWNNDSSMMLITKSGSGEHFIRPNATFAADLSFLYRFGDFDEKVVGTSRAMLLSKELIPILRYLVRTHKEGDLKTDDGESWGDAWQSAHWTAAIGNAAWWSWDALPQDVRQGVRKVVAHEADRIEHTVPPHNLKLDSKSEENAWNSQVLSAALLLMPSDARCSKWELAVKKWSLTSYLRQADSTSNDKVDNIPISTVFTGANIHNDYTLENHDIVHPDYMGAWIMNAGNDLDYLLTGRKTSETFLYNLSHVYDKQKRFYLPDGSYCYPNGQDWAIFRNADWMPCHATAVARFNDQEGLYYLHNALDAAEKMQARNSNGAIYAPGENFFPSSQPHLAYWLTQAWLILHFATKDLKETTPHVGVNNLEEGKIILHRDDKAIQTVSWGEQKMIQMMPIAKDHIISPDQRNGIGRVVVSSSRDKYSTLGIKLKNIEVNPSKNGFTVKMVINHGNLVQSELYCQTKSDGSFKIKEKLTALQSCTTDTIETLTFGILNNPNWVYETGKRNLKLGNQFYEAKAGTDLFFSNNAKSVFIDNLHFKMDNVSTITYKIAKQLERSRYTDRLVLNSIPTKHDWKKDEVISEHQLTIEVQAK